MRPGKIGFLAVTAGLVIGLVSCGRAPEQSDAITAGGPGLTQDEVQRQDAAADWADDYCTAVGVLVDDLARMPAVDPTTPRRAVQTSGDVLGAMIGGLDKTVGGLRALPPAPVADGGAVRDNTINQLTGVRERAAAAKQQLDGAGNAPQISQTTLGAARGPLDEVSKIDLLAGLNSVPDLQTAAAHAPVCQQLTAHTPG